MGIWLCGRRFDLRYEANIALVPQLAQQLARETSQESAPARDLTAQASDRLTLTTRVA